MMLNIGIYDAHFLMLVLHVQYILGLYKGLTLDILVMSTATNDNN
jgi:hypothetical protein